MNRHRLTDHRYGKTAVRLVYVDRTDARHRLADLTVDVTLTGDFAETYYEGDNRRVLATDSQKNAVYALAREDGLGSVEDFGLRLCDHFVTSQEAVTRARVGLTVRGWEHAATGTSFIRSGPHQRTATVVRDGDLRCVVGGVQELALLKTTGSQFRGFPRDRFTTLAEADDRLLATTVRARWRYLDAQRGVDWAARHDAVQDALVAAFARVPSGSLQKTLFAMGSAALDACPSVAEIRLALPNQHHIVVDLSPMGMDNPDQVYLATDQPYGLIEGTVSRADCPPVPVAWW